MRPAIAAVHDLVASITPTDELEAQHRTDTLRWLCRTDDVFRRERPATPLRHLVSYVVPVDRTAGTVLLVDHRSAGLWLPPGGHVDPGEHPAHAASREAQEELGIHADSSNGLDRQPVFLTVSPTVGTGARHRRQPLVPAPPPPR